MAQKYQEQQLAAIKDTKASSFNSDSSGSSSGSETVPLDLTFANMSMIKPPVSPVLQSVPPPIPSVNQSMPAPQTSPQLSQFQPEPIKSMPIPRYEPVPRSEVQPVPQQQQQQTSIIPPMSRQQPQPLYQRSFSDNTGYEQPQPPAPTTTTNNGYNQGNNYSSRTSVVRPIKKILNE